MPAGQAASPVGEQIARAAQGLPRSLFGAPCTSRSGECLRALRAQRRTGTGWDARYGVVWQYEDTTRRSTSSSPPLKRVYSPSGGPVPPGNARLMRARTPSPPPVSRTRSQNRGYYRCGRPVPQAEKLLYLRRGSEHRCGRSRPEARPAMRKALLTIRMAIRLKSGSVDAAPVGNETDLFGVVAAQRGRVECPSARRPQEIPTLRPGLRRRGRLDERRFEVGARARCSSR